jgi:hypothetical protein
MKNIKNYLCLIFFTVIILSACGGDDFNRTDSPEKKDTIYKASGPNEILVKDEIMFTSSLKFN